MLLLSLLALNLWLRPLEADPLPAPIDEGNASAAHDFIANFGTRSTPADGYSFFHALSEKATNSQNMDLRQASLSSTGKIQEANHDFLNLDLTLGSPWSAGQVHTGHSQKRQGGSKNLAPAVDLLCSHSLYSSETKASDHHSNAFTHSTTLKAPTASTSSCSTPHPTPLGISEENHPVVWERPQTLPEEKDEHPRSPLDVSDVPMLDRERIVEHFGGGNDQATPTLHRGTQSFQNKAQSLHKKSDHMNEGDQSLHKEAETLRKKTESLHEEAYSLHADASPITDDSVTVGRSLHGRKRTRENKISTLEGVTPFKSRSQPDRSMIQRMKWIPDAETQNHPKRQKNLKEFSSQQVHDRYPEEEILLQNLELHPKQRELSFNFCSQQAHDYYEGIQKALCGITIFKYPQNGLFMRPSLTEEKTMQIISNQAYRNGKKELEVIRRPDTFKLKAEEIYRKKGIIGCNHPKLIENIPGSKFYVLREWLNHCLPIIIHDIRVLCKIFPKVVAEKNTSVKEIQRNAWYFYAFFWNNLGSINQEGSKISKRIKESSMSLFTLEIMISKIEKMGLSEMGGKRYKLATARKFMTIWLAFFHKKLYLKASKGKNQEVNKRFIGLLNYFYEYD